MERIRPLPTPQEPPPLVVGVKEQPSPLETGQKKQNPKLRAPSRQVKVQDAPLPVASSGKGREPEPSAQQTPAPHPCPFRRLLFFLPSSSSSFSLHPLLIKVGSFHDNHSQRACIANELDFGDVDISRLHCLFSDTV